LLFHLILHYVTNPPEAAALNTLLTNTYNFNCTIIITYEFGAKYIHVLVPDDREIIDMLI